MSDEKSKRKVCVYIMGRPYDVPAGLTIQTAMEYAGYRLKRGCGCRGGFCGACVTIYRKKNDYKLYADLACQKIVEEGIQIMQIPFAPAHKVKYDLMADESMSPSAATVLKYYPEVARCVSCNRCNEACPQDIDAMEAINSVLQGDIKKAAEKSFDCISCGICALRCPAEIAQHNVFQLVRRLYGKHVAPPYTLLKRRIKEIEEGEYEKDYRDLKRMPKKELRQKYVSREIKLD